MKKLLFFILFILISVNVSFSEESDTNPSPRLNFINEAYKYLKTPYKYAGANYEGIDCSGLVYCAALNSLKKALPRRAIDIANFSKKISNEDIQPGDLLFFNTFGNKISHVAIYIGDGEFIHSASAGPDTGVIISSLTENYWKKRFLFAGRIFPKEKKFE